MKATCRINDKTEDNKSFSKFHSELDKTNKKCVKANAAGNECAKCAEGYKPVAPTKKGERGRRPKRLIAVGALGQLMH